MNPTVLRTASAIAVLVVCLQGEISFAQIHGPKAPDTLSFQGYLTDLGGTPINSTVNITTTFYKNGSPGYAQVHSNVSVVNGVFNLLIGPVDTVAFDQPIDIGIKVGTDPEILPRTPLVGAPFALGMRGMYAIAAEDASYTGLNIVGGWKENYVASGVVGATISGGGGIRGSTSEPDSVTGDMGTVGGGLANNAGIRAVVGGGRLNRATGTESAVGGGLQNTASGGFATVAGGQYNWATAVGATVGGGYFNEADSYGTVSGGSNNSASGDHGTVPGGRFNQANGERSFAAGWAAHADHFGSFVWADGINTNPPTAWLSTGDNQFLIRADGGMGVGTNAPLAALHVVRDINAAGSVDNHVMLIENAATGTNGDGLAIMLGAANPGASNNFISFFDGDSVAYGRIDGNGTNGVVYGTTGGDYAEYLSRLDPQESIEAGDVVAVVNRHITRTTRSGHRLMVISDRPAVLGNMPTEAEQHLFEPTAFIGQVPVKVIGPVAAGDYLVPSGNDDGAAIARKPADVRPADLDRIVGVAWESSDRPGPKKVIAEVGLDRARATRLAFENELAGLWQVVRTQQERLSELENRAVN